jgi:hypothetical protein
MPRIEIIPVNWESSTEKANGDGTPTIDLCRSCAGGIIEGDEIADVDDGLAIRFPKAVIGSINVDHPPFSFDGDVYTCDLCDAKLEESD